MPDETSFDAASLVTSAETAAGFWQMGILWTPLISGESTRGTYSLMEQLMPAKAGPPRMCTTRARKSSTSLTARWPCSSGTRSSPEPGASSCASRRAPPTPSPSGPRPRGC